MKNYFPIFLHVCNPKVDIIFYILISFYTFTPVYNLLFVSWWRVIFIYNGEVETYLDNTVVVLEQCLLSQSVLYMFILYGAKFKVWCRFYPWVVKLHDDVVLYRSWELPKFTPNIEIII